MIGRDPIRLEGVESQFEELSKLVGQLIKSLGEEGTKGAVERGCGAGPGTTASRASAAASASSAISCIARWRPGQATQLMQSEKLKRLIFGMGAITALALC